jgi:hypothetical protein
MRSTQEYSLVITEVIQVRKQTAPSIQRFNSKADIVIPSFKRDFTQNPTQTEVSDFFLKRNNIVAIAEATRAASKLATTA